MYHVTEAKTVSGVASSNRHPPSYIQSFSHHHNYSQIPEYTKHMANQFCSGSNKVRVILLVLPHHIRLSSAALLTQGENDKLTKKAMRHTKHKPTSESSTHTAGVPKYTLPETVILMGKLNSQHPCRLGQ